MEARPNIVARFLPAQAFSSLSFLESGLSGDMATFGVKILGEMECNGQGCSKVSLSSRPPFCIPSQRSLLLLLGWIFLAVLLVYSPVIISWAE